MIRNIIKTYQNGNNINLNEKSNDKYKNKKLIKDLKININNIDTNNNSSNIQLISNNENTDNKIDNSQFFTSIPEQSLSNVFKYSATNKYSNPINLTKTCGITCSKFLDKFDKVNNNVKKSNKIISNCITNNKQDFFGKSYNVNKNDISVKKYNNNEKINYLTTYKTGFSDLNNKDTNLTNNIYDNSIKSLEKINQIYEYVSINKYKYNSKNETITSNKNNEQFINNISSSIDENMSLDSIANSLMGEEGKEKLKLTRKSIKDVFNNGLEAKSLNREIEAQFLKKKTIKRFKTINNKLDYDSDCNDSKEEFRKLEKIANVYDSISEDELDDNQNNCNYNINNLNYNFFEFSVYSYSYKKILYYKLITNFIILLFLIIFPINICFFPMSINYYYIFGNNISKFNYLIMYFIKIYDIFYFLNFVFNLFIVYNKKHFFFSFKGIKRFYKKEFVIMDILLCIPYNIIYEIICRSSNYFLYYELSMIFSYFRWIKMCDIIKIRKYINYFIINLEITSFFSILLGSIFYLLYFHITSCIWIFISSLKFNETNQTNWILKNNLNNNSMFEIYIVSLYYIFATLFTVGYGDIIPTSITEQILSTFIIIFSYIIYTILFSSISSYYSRDASDLQKIEKCKDILSSINKETPIPNSLQNKIIKFYTKRLKLQNNKLFQEGSKELLLENIPKNLKYELLTIMYGKTLTKINFFHNCIKEFNIFTLSLLKPLNLDKQEILLSVGDTFEDIYFVLKGQLNFFLLLNYYKPKKFFSVTKGLNFGEISILDRETIDYEISSSKTKETELLVLSKQDLLVIKVNYPEIIKEKIKYAIDIFEKMEKNKNLCIRNLKQKLINNIDINKNISDLNNIKKSKSIDNILLRSPIRGKRSSIIPELKDKLNSLAKLKTKIMDDNRDNSISSTNKDLESKYIPNTIAIKNDGSNLTNIEYNKSISNKTIISNSNKQKILKYKPISKKVNMYKNLIGLKLIKLSLNKDNVNKNQKIEKEKKKDSIKNIYAKRSNKNAIKDKSNKHKIINIYQKNFLINEKLKNLKKKFFEEDNALNNVLLHTNSLDKASSIILKKPQINSKKLAIKINFYKDYIEDNYYKNMYYMYKYYSCIYKNYYNQFNLNFNNNQISIHKKLSNNKNNLNLPNSICCFDKNLSKDNYIIRINYNNPYNSASDSKSNLKQKTNQVFNKSSKKVVKNCNDQKLLGFKDYKENNIFQNINDKSILAFENNNNNISKKYSTNKISNNQINNYEINNEQKQANKLKNEKVQKLSIKKDNPNIKQINNKKNLMFVCPEIRDTSYNCVKIFPSDNNITKKASKGSLSKVDIYLNKIEEVCSNKKKNECSNVNIEDLMATNNIIIKDNKKIDKNKSNKLKIKNKDIRRLSTILLNNIINNSKYNKNEDIQSPKNNNQKNSNLILRNPNNNQTQKSVNNLNDNINHNFLLSNRDFKINILKKLSNNNLKKSLETEKFFKINGYKNNSYSNTLLTYNRLNNTNKNSINVSYNKVHPSNNVSIFNVNDNKFDYSQFLSSNDLFNSFLLNINAHNLSYNNNN